MEYSSPELVVLGRVETVVQGILPVEGDHPDNDSQPLDGLALGLDD